MANTLYNVAREAFLTGQLNWLSPEKPIKVRLGRKSGMSDQQPASMASFGTTQGDSAVWATPPVTLTNRTATNGAADGADVTFTAVTGSSIDCIVLYAEGETPDTSIPIAVIDTATGLPITPNGGDIIVTWDNGENKIFKL